MNEPRRQFLRRTKPPSLEVVTNTTEVVTGDTKKVQVPRGPSKFSRNETRRFNSNGGARRTERPSRNFARRRPEGSVTTSTASSSSSPTPTTVTRRPFRIASRRRPSSTTTLATTTTTAAPTTLDLESDEYLQDVGDISDIDAIEDPTLEPRAPKKPLKTQRRPLVNLKNSIVRGTDRSADQNPSATNEETKRQSKKYSSTFRQNQLDGLLKKGETSTTFDDYNAETALAIATHKLITAPLPIINDYDEPQTKTTQTDRTADFTLPTTDITSTFGQFDATRVNTDKSDIDTGKVTFGYPIEATHIPTNDYEFTTPGATKTFATPDVTKVFPTLDTVTRVFAPEVTGYTGYVGIQRGAVKYSEFATVPSPTIGFDRYPTRSSQERSEFTREYLLESPLTKTYNDEYQYLSPTTPQTPRKVFRKKIQRRISTTLRPTVAAFSESNISPDGRALFAPRMTSTYPKVSSTRTYEPKVTSPKSYDPEVTTPRSTEETTTSSRTYLPRVTKPSGFVPQATAANEYWPESADKDYLPEVTGRSYVAEVSTRNYVPEVTSRYVPEVTSRPYVPEVTSIRNFSPETISTRGYSSEVSSARNYAPEVTPTRNYSPEVISTINYSPAVSSTRNFSPEVTSTKNYSPEVTSTRNYSPAVSSTKNYSPEVTSTRNYSPELTTTRSFKSKVTTPKPFEKVTKKKTYKPVVNFDYYDDSAEKIALKYAEGTKVIYHGKGSVECLDVGNFPHPSSCKKFISCARMEFGSLLGWEYVCPKGLSFDPVGGICNWSAGLGCDEKDV